ncbi:hypothetical protein [Pontixanthobacter aquaemixtae]|uniref:Lipoprotein n=1 Tax=Pontixanthobacter aquaemixtae TaxID=1958940 RepID=A0A844ZUI1_9SPHN|nr:hypothetical protein [Pontixanthobacter aquaemixtae]MXO91398.1 hypothetical protein [Pontixanthobacter aquaemixtae]
MLHSRRYKACCLAAFFALALQGCIAKTAVDVVTAPVRMASKAVDFATVSQSERDERRGREIREEEERIGKLERQYDSYQRDCENGDRRACKKARETYAELYPDD